MNESLKPPWGPVGDAAKACLRRGDHFAFAAVPRGAQSDDSVQTGAIFYGGTALEHMCLVLGLLDVAIKELRLFLRESGPMSAAAVGLFGTLVRDVVPLIKQVQEEMRGRKEVATEKAVAPDVKEGAERVAQFIIEGLRKDLGWGEEEIAAAKGYVLRLALDLAMLAQQEHQQGGEGTDG